MKPTKPTPEFILNAFTKPYSKDNHRFLADIRYETLCPVRKIVLCSVKDFCAN